MEDRAYPKYTPKTRTIVEINSDRVESAIKGYKGRKSKILKIFNEIGQVLIVNHSVAGVVVSSIETGVKEMLQKENT